MDDADADVTLPDLDIPHLLIGQPFRRGFLDIGLHLIPADGSRRTHPASRRQVVSLRDQRRHLARCRNQPQHNPSHDRLALVIRAIVRPYQSWRRALTGSTRLARRAGTKLANRAATTSTETIKAKVNGSTVCMPSTLRANRRPAASAASTPALTPTKTIPRLCRSTSLITSRALAPSAIRTPISGTRWPVTYARTP